MKSDNASVHKVCTELPILKNTFQKVRYKINMYTLLAIIINKHIQL